MYFCWGVNGLIIVASMFFEIRKFFKQKVCKKNKNQRKEKPKMKHPSSNMRLKKNYEAEMAAAAAEEAKCMYMLPTVRQQEISVIPEEQEHEDHNDSC